MKRTKSRTASKTSHRVALKGKAARKEADLAAIRAQIANLVGNQAVGMVETTIAEVEKGHYLALKYLFEMIGLYPTAGVEESGGDDSMARTLLRRLGIPEETSVVESKLESSVTNDTGESAATTTNDALE